MLVISAHHVFHNTKGMAEVESFTMESTDSSASLINVKEVAKVHASIMPNLLAAHALTGCDTVSSFSGIGKMTVVKKLQGLKEQLNLGDISADFPDVLRSSTEFVLQLYGETESDLNKARESFFRKKISNKRFIPPKLQHLPPTMSSFETHVRRAHFQAAVWVSAGEDSPPDLSPLDFGWEKHHNMLQPAFGTAENFVAPDEVLNIVSCGCKTGCSSALCSCTRLLMVCTEFCKCKGGLKCLNRIASSKNDDESL